MAYSYGTQGAPAVGGGAPGLPSRKQAEQSTYTRIVSGSGVLLPPQGAKFMRVAVIGAGGGCDTNNRGGGGGGCAASKLVAAAPITYSIGIGSTGNGGDTVAIFPGYTLVGKGGTLGTGLTSGVGGTGQGGDYNYSGGSVGGGAAGPNGNGGDGGTTPTAGQFDGRGWGPGGGGGNMAGTTGQGGSGTGVIGRKDPGAVSTVYQSANDQWGRTPPSANTNGGEMGGGAGYTAPCNGGSGGMVVEWFY